MLVRTDNFLPRSSLAAETVKTICQLIAKSTEGKIDQVLLADSGILKANNLEQLISQLKSHCYADQKDFRNSIEVFKNITDFGQLLANPSKDYSAQLCMAALAIEKIKLEKIIIQTADQLDPFSFKKILPEVTPAMSTPQTDLSLPQLAVNHDMQGTLPPIEKDRTKYAEFFDRIFSALDQLFALLEKKYQYYLILKRKQLKQERKKDQRLQVLPK